MSDKNEVSTAEHAAPKPGKKAALKRHCARFWWIHLIIFIAIAVFIVLITIFVAVPRIAQDKINQAKLEIVAVKITNPHPDYYTMAINSTISTDGSVQANIDPFDGDMYLDDTEDKTPFAVLNFPATTAAKHSDVNFVQHHVTIPNMDAFKQFNAWFVNNETINIGLKGKTHVQPKGLSRKYSVTFHKVLPVKGLNNFKGLEVIDPRVQLTVKKDNDTDFRNFFAKSVLPNPSHFTLEVGNATFDNSFLGQSLGNLYIQDLVLAPGNNTVDVTGDLQSVKILSLVQGAKPYCETGIAPFSLTGLNVTDNGEEIPYFAYGLAHSNVTVNLDVAETLKNTTLADVPISCT